MNKNLFGIVVVLALLGAGAYFTFNLTPVEVNDFESCANAEGSVIMESYPEQCRTESGEVFTRELTVEESPNLPQSSEEPAEEEPVEEPENVGVANPASVNCIEKGGELELRDGGGFCIFEDGSECEEWAFFRGECSM